MLEEKIKSIFSEMIVLKDPKRAEFFSNLSLPSYMRDWLVMKFSDEAGVVDYDNVLRYIKKFIPGREDLNNSNTLWSTERKFVSLRVYE